MDFPYLLRNPKFSEAEVIANDLLKKKKKKRSQTLYLLLYQSLND